MKTLQEMLLQKYMEDYGLVDMPEPEPQEQGGLMALISAINEAPSRAVGSMWDKSTSPAAQAINKHSRRGAPASFGGMLADQGGVNRGAALFADMPLQLSSYLPLAALKLAGKIPGLAGLVGKGAKAGKSVAIGKAGVKRAGLPASLTKGAGGALGEVTEHAAFPKGPMGMITRLRQPKGPMGMITRLRQLKDPVASTMKVAKKAVKKSPRKVPSLKAAVNVAKTKKKAPKVNPRQQALLEETPAVAKKAAPKVKPVKKAAPKVKPVKKAAPKVKSKAPTRNITDLSPTKKTQIKEELERQLALATKNSPEEGRLLTKIAQLGGKATPKKGSSPGLTERLAKRGAPIRVVKSSVELAVNTAKKQGAVVVPANMRTTVQTKLGAGYKTIRIKGSDPAMYKISKGVAPDPKRRKELIKLLHDAKKGSAARKKYLEEFRLLEDA